MSPTPTLFDGDNPLVPRREGGRRAKRAGSAFEDLIFHSQSDAQGDVLSLVRIKNFAKRIPKRLPSGAVESQLVEEKSPCDFAGSICETGQCIAFDAKSTESASFGINKDEVVKPHQIRELHRLQKTGKAVAGFLVLCKRHKTILWLWADRAWTARLRNQPLQWDDKLWVVGPEYREGSIIKFRALLDALEKR